MRCGRRGRHLAAALVAVTLLLAAARLLTTNTTAPTRRAHGSGLPWALSRFPPDSLGYRVQPYAFASDHTRRRHDQAHGPPPPPQPHEVALVTQCSVQHLGHVLGLAAAWGGPVSVAVFITSAADLTTAVLFLEAWCSGPADGCSSSSSSSSSSGSREGNVEMAACREWVDVHFCYAQDSGRFAEAPDTQPSVSGLVLHRLYPQEADGVTDGPPSPAPHGGLLGGVLSFSAGAGSVARPTGPCPSPAEMLSRARAGNYDGQLPYPNNKLRNLARRHTDAAFVMVIDVDMLPSAGLRERFLQHQQQERGGGLNAFVVPAFEVRLGSERPATREALLAAYSARRAQPFYYQVCWKCQRHTDYEQWLREVARGEWAYEVPWHDPWEPFYIARNDATTPAYDERFEQYGFNRISQVCELQVAGFDFRVLRFGFLTHHGFKVPGEFHPSKKRELDRNRNLFRRFKTELRLKYPHSHRRC